MADVPKSQGSESDTEGLEQVTTLQVGMGELCILDVDGLDVDLEMQGVIAVFNDANTGNQSRLVGRGEGTSYRQVWEPIGISPDEERRKFPSRGNLSRVK